VTSGVQELPVEIEPEPDAASLAFHLRAAMGEAVEEGYLYLCSEDVVLFQVFLEKIPVQLAEALSGLLTLKSGRPLDRKLLYRSFYVLRRQWGYLGFYQIWQLYKAAEEMLEPFLSEAETSVPPDVLDSLGKVLEVSRSQVERIAKDLSEERVEVFDAGSVLQDMERQVSRLKGRPIKGDVLEKLSRAFKPSAEMDERFKDTEEKMEVLLGYLAELSLSQASLQQETRNKQDGKASLAMTRMARTINKIRDQILALRQVSVQPLFDQARWTVEHFSMVFKKKIGIAIEGSPVLVDQTLLGALVEPVSQLLKNAVEHGIETDDERLAAGKPAEGRIKIKTGQKSGFFLLEIEDDGHGLDLDKLREKGVALGMLKDEKAAPSRIMEMIFKPGVTTLDDQSKGRGVGLDLVEDRIQSLHGSIRVQSRSGLGCKFLIKVPQSQSLVEGWVVQASQKFWLLPSSQVIKIAPPEQSLSASTSPDPSGVDLGAWFGDERTNLPKFLIHMESGSEQFKLLVDEVVGQQQVLIKKNDPAQGNRPGVLGEGVLVDGRAGLILDTRELVQSLKQKGGKT
jgi:signal transduction histidine kinase